MDSWMSAVSIVTSFASPGGQCGSVLRASTAEEGSLTLRVMLPH